jgi:hypothetical protein
LTLDSSNPGLSDEVRGSNKLLCIIATPNLTFPVALTASVSRTRVLIKSMGGPGLTSTMAAEPRGQVGTALALDQALATFEFISDPVACSKPSPPGARGLPGALCL